MSVREDLTNKIAEHIEKHYKSERGVDVGLSPINKGFYRTVNFGYNRTMDAQV